jgi:hypothetical protein
MQFQYRLLVHQRPSNFNAICNGSNLTIFYGLSNDNEIWMTINLKVEEHINKLFLFLIFFCIYLEVNRQDCQNNLLSTDPFS